MTPYERGKGRAEKIAGFPVWRLELLGMGGGLPGGAWDIELGCRLDQEGIG